MKPIPLSVLAAFASAAAFGQTPAPRLAFEVASIRPSAPAANALAGLHLDGAQFNCVQESLHDYVAMAFKVKQYQVSGPDWMPSERFDINAKIPAGASSSQIPEMLQALLADRFGMKFHKEMREFPVYALVMGKGPLKMKEWPPDPPAGANGDPAPVSVSATGGTSGATIDLGHGSSLSFSLENNTIEGRKLPAAAIADNLAGFVGRPVVDETGLKGTYDFTLQFNPDDFRAMMIRSAAAQGQALPAEVLKSIDAASGDSLFSALEAQGLKLEQRKAPIAVFVIDHLEKSPTGN